MHGRVCESVKVENVTPSGKGGQFSFCGYTMECGEAVDFSLPSAREDSLRAVLQIHLSGWCHGDARSANVVAVHNKYKFIDFLEAFRFDGELGPSFVMRDVTLLVQSVCARIQKGVSSNVNLSSHLVDFIREYGKCFYNLHRSWTRSSKR